MFELCRLVETDKNQSRKASVGWLPCQCWSFPHPAVHRPHVQQGQSEPSAASSFLGELLKPAKAVAKSCVVPCTSAHAALFAGVHRQWAPALSLSHLTTPWGEAIRSARRSDQNGSNLSLGGLVYLHHFKAATHRGWPVEGVS